MLTTYVLREGTIPLAVEVVTGPLDKGRALGMISAHYETLEHARIDEADIEWTPDEYVVAEHDDLEVLSSTDSWAPGQAPGDLDPGMDVWVLLGYGSEGGTDGPWLGFVSDAFLWVLDPPDALDPAEEHWLVNSTDRARMQGYAVDADGEEFTGGYTCWAFNVEIGG